MSEPSKSVLCATMHKAGSSIADLILTDICTARGLEMDRISLQVPKSPLPAPEVFIGYQDRMRPEGVYYGVARGPFVSQMPVIYDLKVIVLVRDPRDCITSAYFSFRESHIEPKDPEKRKAFLARRERLQNLDIDAYALDQAKGYKTRMKILQDIAERHEDRLVVTYEDMVTRTEDWLAQVADFLGQPITPALREALGDKTNFRVRDEDTSRHKRQVRPGDHIRKLAPETIAAITEEMRPELTFFGYDAT